MSTDRFSAGPFTSQGGGIHVFPVTDGARETAVGLYNRDERGSVRERARLVGDKLGIGITDPRYMLDVGDIARFRSYLVDDLPAGEVGCIAVAVDHRYGPGTGFLAFHNGKAWEEVGRVSLAGQPVTSEPMVPRSEFDALKAQLEQLMHDHAALRHAFENHSHAHDTLVD